MHTDIRIDTLVPHQGTMCLWQKLLDFDAEHVRLATASHRDADNPLRSDGRLRAVHLCEYGAQAMAVHGGLLQQQGGVPRRGFLVALRDVTLHVSRIDDLPGDLHCHASLLMASESSQQYQFHISADTQLLATGRASVILQQPQSQ
ncbi:phosphotransferase [Lysobacteraceae bacterium NML120232]|nr:phosphotransferase [Xanthomonadaceae bacterium NML08-0793]PJK11664.1 phosphotransferase [Xanthomonadaceae bacterium NML120232]